ncbi:MAG: carboxypeptidase-like regulatory domain-containing protein [Planctomycetaceae bacterium]|jgi:hypothetical protein|nr:carboxypeptidase-like regulatory domain-containing protein [Planctomycetaceae bacterium]
MKQFIIILSLCIFCTGCGSKVPTGFPKTVPCGITVTDDGKPLEGVFVMLHNAGTSNYSCVAVTDANGRAEMQTSQGSYTQKGVPLGNAVVTLAKLPVVDDWKTTEELAAMPMAEQMKYSAEKNAKSAKLPLIIPTKLTEQSTSPLSKEITAATDWKIDVAEYR